MKPPPNLPSHLLADRSGSALKISPMCAKVTCHTRCGHCGMKTCNVRSIRTWVHLNFACALTANETLGYARGTSCPIDLQRVHCLRELYSGVLVGSRAFA